MTGLFGKLARGHILAPQRMQRVYQAHRETAGRSKSGQGRQIGSRGDEQWRLYMQQTQAFPCHIVLDIIEALDVLGLRITEPVGLVEQGTVALDGDVDVLIDSRTDYRTAVSTEKIGQIGASPGK